MQWFAQAGGAGGRCQQAAQRLHPTVSPATLLHSEAWLGRGAETIFFVRCVLVARRRPIPDRTSSRKALDYPSDTNKRKKICMTIRFATPAGIPTLWRARGSGKNGPWA